MVPAAEIVEVEGIPAKTHIGIAEYFFLLRILDGDAITDAG
jgi:hypothetical protein